MSFTQTDLEAFLDEALPVEAMARIEQALRGDPAVAERLATIVSQRDAGVHSLGAIWRRERLTCPTREQLGSFLLGVSDAELADYVTFHVTTAGCRACQANLEDLRARAAEPPAASETRRRRYFQSSAGKLRNKTEK